jgi:hypothetical protein
LSYFFLSARCFCQGLFFQILLLSVESRGDRDCFLHKLYLMILQGKSKSQSSRACQKEVKHSENVLSIQMQVETDQVAKSRNEMNKLGCQQMIFKDSIAFFCFPPSSPLYSHLHSLLYSLLYSPKQTKKRSNIVKNVLSIQMQE